MDNNKPGLNIKFVFRRIELSDGLQYNSLNTFFTKFIQGLDREKKYRITVRLIQSGNKNITSDDVIDVGSKFGLNGRKKDEVVYFDIEFN